MRDTDDETYNEIWKIAVFDVVWGAVNDVIP